MTPDVTIPRQLAPTVGPAVESVTFHAGSKSGFKNIAIGQVEDINGVPFIDDSEWGPEADHVEFGYIVPIGSVKVFVGSVSRKPEGATQGSKSAEELRPVRVRVLEELHQAIAEAPVSSLSKPLWGSLPIQEGNLKIEEVEAIRTELCEEAQRLAIERERLQEEDRRLRRRQQKRQTAWTKTTPERKKLQEADWRLRRWQQKYRIKTDKGEIKPKFHGNPESNVHAAIGILSRIVPVGDTQADKEARYAIDLLQTAALQQANMYGVTPNEPQHEVSWGGEKYSVEKVVNQLAGLQVSLEKDEEIKGESPAHTAAQPAQDEADSDEDTAPVSSYSLLKGPACFGEEIRLTRFPPSLGESQQVTTYCED